MKKTTSFLGALLLSSAFIVPVQAADTQDITTIDKSKTQEGTVYGSLSGTALTQLKVTMPIKLDLAVAPAITMEDATAPAAANKVYAGDYKIKVASDSEVGVQLDNVNIKKIGVWTLGTKTTVDGFNMSQSEAEAAPTAAKTIALNLGGKELKHGDTPFTADEYVVGIAQEKSLGVTGTAGKVWLDKGLQATSEGAFIITYTISQK